MPKKWFKSWMPSPEFVQRHRSLSFLGTLLHDPYLFHLNRHSVSVAFFVGLFVAFLPLPGQIPLAAFLALRFRCNLPLSVILVWVSNPLTFAFIFYMEYRLGSSILMLPETHFYFEWSWQWFNEFFPRIWKPLLLGSILCSLFFSCLGYLVIQWSWRWQVGQKWLKRKEKKSAKR